MKRKWVVPFFATLLILLSSCGLRKAKLVNTQELTTNKVESINISYETDDINIYEHSSDDIKIEEYLDTSKKMQKQ